MAQKYYGWCFCPRRTKNTDNFPKTIFNGRIFITKNKLLSVFVRKITPN